MSSINKILGIIINKQSQFCCLCLDIICDEEVIHIKDEVVVNVNGSESMLQMSEVLQFILGAKMHQHINTFDTMCDKCTRTTLSSYTFIQTSQRNAEYIASCLEALTNSLEHTTDDLNNSKSLYVSLNLEDFTSKQLYDCEKIVNNTKAILQRFETVESTSKLKSSNQIKVKKNIKRRKTDYLKMLLDPNNPESIKCKECFNVYPHLCSLKNHYTRMHAPKTFKCPKCPCSYGSKSFLDAHERESHCTIVCSKCGKTFNNRHTLKMHEMGHKFTIICPDCGRVYKNRATFKKHKELNVCGQKTRANPSNAKFTCDYCNKKYTQKVSLRVHIQYEHGNYKAHICEWCGKKFWAQSRLKAHIVKHTKERNFSCSICGGKFVTKESLLYHTRTHTGERPYECMQCNSRFLSASRRTEHVKRHHNGATLECDICHSKFNSITYLQKHKKTHEIIENKLIKNEIKSKYYDIDANSSSDTKVYNIVKTEVTESEYKNDFCDNNMQSDDEKMYLEVYDDGNEYLVTIDNAKV